jgi:hypothetical protein
MTQSDESSKSQSSVDPGYIPSNPWRVTLVAIWVIAVIVGVFLLIIGAVQYGQYAPNDGLVQLLFGGTLASIGFVSFIVWIGAEMVLWKGASARGYISRVDRDNRSQSE